jgi:hypothetical protein
MNKRRRAKIGVGALCAAILVVALPASAYAISAGRAVGEVPFAAGYFAFTESQSASGGVTFKIPAVTGCGSKPSVVILERSLLRFLTRPCSRLLPR